MSIAKTFFDFFRPLRKPSKLNPLILQQKKHGIPLDKIDKGVIDILHRLRSRRFDARLVGGCVRDLLLGKKPKDFDIVTDARPQQVRNLFHGCRLIGRRFRLAHVPTSRGQLVEVATYRGEYDPPANEPTNPPDPKDRFIANNVFGTIEQDAFRRDFTVNALYYDFKDHSVIDYTGGISDLRKKTLRSIKEPHASFKEDPVRIIRAARFAAILGFELSKEDLKAAHAHASLMAAANPSRMLEEMRKILRCGNSAETFQQLQKYGCLQYWIPEMTEKTKLEAITRRLAIMDRHIREGKSFSEEIMLACLCFELFLPVIAPFGDKGFHQTFELININFRKLAISLRVPRWVWHGTAEIAARQAVFRRKPGGKRWYKFLRAFLRSPMQKEAIHFLEMENELTGEWKEELAFWKNVQMPQQPAPRHPQQRHSPHPHQRQGSQTNQAPHQQHSHHPAPHRHRTPDREEKSDKPETTLQPDVR